MQPNTSPLFPGARLFQMRDTHGIPLDMAIDKIINDSGLRIEWPSFIQAAREAGWLDRKIYETVEFALSDAGVERELRAGILAGHRAYMMQHPAL